MQTVDRQASSCSILVYSWLAQLCASSACKGNYSFFIFLHSKQDIFIILDTCQGDSGGPLMAFTTSNQWVLIGATSSGVGCARQGYAGIYTRIVNYQSWINSNTGGQFTNPTSSVLTSSTTEINPNAKCTGTIHYRSTRLFLLILALLIFNTMKSL